MLCYTYLIGWSKHHRYYYGVRYATDCHPLDLWKKYKTSSKYVNEFAEENGDPDIIQVRKTFENPRAAQEWEHKVLRRMKVTASEIWLNETDNKSISYEKGLEGSALGASKIRGKKQSKEHVAKRVAKQINKPRSPETKTKISKTRKERNIPSARKGVKLSAETKSKIAKSRKEDTRTCEYCNNNFNLLNYLRWHGAKCKKGNIT